MINVVRQDRNTIHYICDCGARGICSFKPASKETAIVINIMCRSCGDAERITLLQYSDNLSRDSILGNINSVDLSWVLSVNEEILSDGDN
jgi:hypothetical protein